MEDENKPKGQSTANQRKQLFETWQATGSVTQACKAAGVERGTFYYWKPRFLIEGYPGIEAFDGKASHAPNRTSDFIAHQVIKLHREHPYWGKAQISKMLTKSNQAKPVISPNTARRILMEAGLWKSCAEVREQIE